MTPEQSTQFTHTYYQLKMGLQIHFQCDVIKNKYILNVLDAHGNADPIECFTVERSYISYPS